MRKVVGWGCMPGELCAFCDDDDERKATVYVYDTETCREDPACNVCSRGLPDDVARIFAQAIGIGQVAEPT